MQSNIRNIGILAHVDAGKTTLTEQLLYKSDIIKDLGSVDKGTAHTDTLEIEQQRGISVKASEVNLNWKGVEINIIDTPGHIDFAGEVERSLGVLDGAVLVISAVEGVQPQTEVYFKALRDMKVPTFIFINKIDRIGADVNRVLNEVKRVLSASAIPLVDFTNIASSETSLGNFTNVAFSAKPGVDSGNVTSSVKSFGNNANVTSSDKPLGNVAKVTSSVVRNQDIVNLATSATPDEHSSNISSAETTLKLITNEEFKDTEIQSTLIETVAESDELLLEKYLEGEEISSEFLKERINTLIGDASVYPVLYGSALKGIGITELLDLILDGTPEVIDYSEEELSGIVFKVKNHKTMGKMAFVRLYSGKIESRDLVYNHSKSVSEKVTLIKKLSGYKEINCGEMSAGEIAWVSGLSNVSIGDILGSPNRIPRVPAIAKPLLTVQIFPKNKDAFKKLAEALQELEEEDPLLGVRWVKEKNELHIQIMGMIQLEILESILLSRFDVAVSFGKPSIIYKETPSKWSLGFEAYTMPKPCWAVVKFEIEPLEAGSGLVYESKVRTDDIKARYQKEIEYQLPITLQQGLYGWEVIDLKVTLIAGEDHVMHSNPGDFLIATAMGIMNGLSNTGTTLLEPIISFRISVPEPVGGKVLNDIIQMRGSFESPVVMNGVFTIEGEMPAATSIEYPIRLGIISSGKGVMSTKLSGYKPVPLELGETRERFGVNPLDRSKYILYARNAIK